MRVCSHPIPGTPPNDDVWIGSAWLLLDCDLVTSPASAEDILGYLGPRLVVAILIADVTQRVADRKRVLFMHRRARQRLGLRPLRLLQTLQRLDDLGHPVKRLTRYNETIGNWKAGNFEIETDQQRALTALAVLVDALVEIPNVTT